MAESFYAELKRRNVFKVGFGYILLGWVVLQVADVVVPALALPEWTMTFMIVIGFFGFPFAIFFAWVYELTPEGIKKESEISPDESITNHTGQKLNLVIIALLAISLGYFIYESRFMTKSSDPALPLTEQTSNAINDEQDEVLEAAYTGTSIAVLPFVNMSSDPEQEFFSDGISEEILNVLAKIPNLKVTSRSSAFAFKGSKINISEVAQKLGVQHVLEGSVRKSGNKVRITAQLIEADSDIHLWSETYDRELNDIFVIQDEISSAIVAALKDNLGINPGMIDKSIQKVNLAAHTEYLQGRFYIEKRTPKDVQRALEHFNKAIAIDSSYAAAWMGKAWATHFSSEFNYGSMPASIATERAMPAVDKALELDPLLPEAHAIKGLLLTSNNDDYYTEAEQYFTKAIELNPNYSDAYAWYAGMLDAKPRLRLELREKSVQLNPMSVLANTNYGYSLKDFGRFEEAVEVAEHIYEIEVSSARYYGLMSTIYEAQGQFGLSVFNRLLRAKVNNVVNNTVFLAFGLYKIGLPELSSEMLVHPEHKHLNYQLNNNYELYLSDVRAIFPRGEADSLGYFILGEAEMFEENYAEAIKFLNKSFCNDCDYLIYAYQQVNDMDSANALLDKVKAEYEFQRAEGLINLEYTAANIAYLENDIDKAIEYTKLAIEKGHPLAYFLDKMPMYADLRAHPGWSEIEKLNEALKKEQSAIYLQQVAENKEGIL